MYPSAKHAPERGSAPGCRVGGWAAAVGTAPGMLEGAAVFVCMVAVLEGSYQTAPCLQWVFLVSLGADFR